MALPVLDFGDVADLTGPSPRVAASLPKLDFSDVQGISARGPQKTGQQKAQDIAHAAGIEVGPDFGSNVFDRGLADFGKGLATSTPGRLIGVATGNSDVTGALGELPASQPIPFFPDLDTIGTLAGDAAMFSLVPTLALPGKVAGKALGGVVGRVLQNMPLVKVALEKGAYSHVQLAQKQAAQLVGASEDLFSAAGATISAGIGFGGLEKIAGGSNESALLQGAMAGAAAGLAPAFRALKASAVLGKVVSGRYIEAEKAVADSLDNAIGTLTGAKQTGLSLGDETVVNMLQKSTLEAISPAFSTQVRIVMGHIAEKGGYAKNVPELRAIIPAWDEVVTQSMKGRAESFFLNRGMDQAYTALSKFTKSVDTSLRQLGPRGVQLANGIRQSGLSSDNVYGKLKAAVNAALEGISDDALEAWTPVREVDGAVGTANGTGFSALARLLDETIPNILRKAGAMIEDLVPGKYLPHHYDYRGLEKAFRSQDILPKLQSVMGISYDKALELKESVLSGIASKVAQPRTLVMRSSIDLSRDLKITIGQARQLGLPIANTRVALDRYMRQVGDRVGFAESFGADFGKAQALLDDLNKLYHSDISKGWIEQSVRKAIGMDGEIGDVSQTFAWLQNNLLVPQTLGLAFISQAGQSTNTIAKVGIRNLLNGTKELRREAKAFAGKGGQATEFYTTMKAVVDATSGGIGDFLSGAERSTGLLLPKAVGRTSVVSRFNLGSFFLSKTGFNSLDSWNRMAAGYAGKSWLESQVTAAVRGTMTAKQLSRTAAEFKRTGLNFGEILRRGAMTSEETTRGSLRISDLTQFRIRPVDLPLFWSSPNAAVFRMLKTFSFNQGRFIQKEIFGAAKRHIASGGREGSLRPLAFFMTGYPMAGYGIGSVRSILKNEEPFADHTALGTYASSMAWVGGLGLLQDIVKSADGGSRAMLQLGAGPGIGLGIDFVDAAIHAIDNPKQLGRFMTRHTIPLVSQNLLGVRNMLDESLGFKD